MPFAPPVISATRSSIGTSVRDRSMAAGLRPADPPDPLGLEETVLVLHDPRPLLVAQPRRVLRAADDLVAPRLEIRAPQPERVHAVRVGAVDGPGPVGD